MNRRRSSCKSERTTAGCARYFFQGGSGRFFASSCTRAPHDGRLERQRPRWPSLHNRNFTAALAFAGARAKRWTSGADAGEKARRRKPMARKYSRSASKEVKGAMRKRKRGTLKRGKGGKGGKVKSRKQA